MDRKIVYDLVGCSLGVMLVAASERGVCRVAFGDREEDLEASLAHELPFARLERDSIAVKPFAQALVAYLDGHAVRLELPLDVSPSRFQARVWEALRRIPRGATRGYGELATELGVAGGARAVARACAANPVAVVIPCHRVVAAGGALSGYRWGAQRKHALLEREGVSLPPCSTGRSASAAR